MRFLVFILPALLLFGCKPVELSEEASDFLENYRLERNAEIEVSSGFEGRIGREDYEIVILEISGDTSLEGLDDAYLESFADSLSKAFYPLILNKKKFNRFRVILRLENGRKTFEFDK